MKVWEVFPFGKVCEGISIWLWKRNLLVLYSPQTILGPTAEERRGAVRAGPEKDTAIGWNNCPVKKGGECWLALGRPDCGLSI